MRVRTPCSMPVSPGRFRTVLRCFPNEGLPGQDLSEKVREVVFSAYMRHSDNASAAQLAHLEHLAVDMSRVLCRREAMAEVVSGFVVGEALDGRVLLMANERERGRHV